MSSSLWLRYTIFAGLATVANIAAQDITIRLYSGIEPVVFSVLIGTIMGLMVKYVLDKKYIFCFEVKNAAHDTRTFVLYTIMGVITTVIFWGFELGFNYIFQTKELRYIGGIIGLVIGYVIKYRLDRRFVFVEGEA